MNINDKFATIGFEDLKVDKRSDTIGKLLLKLEMLPTWTKEKRTLHEKLLKEVKKRKYFYFWSNCQKYLLSRIGESAVYVVPKNKRGHLSPFRGKKVRIICVGCGSHGDRFYAIITLS